MDLVRLQNIISTLSVGSLLISSVHLIGLTVCSSTLLMSQLGDALNNSHEPCNTSQASGL